MKNELIYRSATIDDIPHLQSLALISYGRFAKVLEWSEMERALSRPELFKELIAGSHAFVCETNSQIVGMAFLVPGGKPTELFPADWSHIRMVGVHPELGGKGIAKHLTQQCIEKAKASGEKIIGLHTSEVMNAARHIYENFGFRIEKEIAQRFGVRYWIYRLDL